jgi:hypothetical protein
VIENFREGSVENKVAFKNIFGQILWFAPVNIISPMLCIHLHIYVNCHRNKKCAGRGNENPKHNPFSGKLNSPEENV